MVGRRLDPARSFLAPVVDLELLSNETVEAYPDAEPTRLLRRLKVKKYRPRYENREPVKTENLVKRYAY